MEGNIDITIIAGIFIIGLILGSFFNVCIHRIPAKKSIIYPPSSCPKCRNPIKLYDNIPIISYTLLGGKCRHCKKPISPRYPAVEILTAIMFVLFFINFGLEKTYFFYIILVGYIIVLSFIDIDKKIVPDGIVLFLLATGLAVNLIGFKQNNGVFDGLIGAILAGFLFYVISYFSGGKMGEGDIKLFTALGFYLGARDVISVSVISFIAGGAIAAVLIVTGVSSRKDKIAFVPFAGLGLIIHALLF